MNLKKGPGSNFIQLKCDIYNTVEQKKITQLELHNLKILMQLAIVAATDSGQKSDTAIIETEDAHTIHTRNFITQ